MGGLFRQYSWVVDLVGILFCSFFLAKITGIYLGSTFEIKRSIGVLQTAEAPLPERKQVDVTEYNVILDRNIFDSSERGSAEAQSEPGKGSIDEAAIATGEAVKTSLNLTVLGVLVVGEGRDNRSSATISMAGGGVGKTGDKSGGGLAKVYAVGDEESFAPSTKLTRVQPDRIEFINNGRLEFAEVATEFGADIFSAPKGETVAAAEPVGEKKETIVQKDTAGKFSVDQREVDEALQNLDKLYTDIRAVPNFSGGKVSGMKVLSVRADSLFAKLGLRRGDVLQRINNIDLDVKQGFEIFNKLKEQKSITLDLLRQGQPTTLEYEIR